MKNYKIVAYTPEGECFYDTGFVYDLHEAQKVVKNMEHMNKVLHMEPVRYEIKGR